MIENRIRNNIKKVTVTFKKLGGRGVLVQGNLIITAAHCIEFSVKGEMALGEYFTETIKTSHGDLIVSPIALEPLSDIAVLGPIDGQEMPEEAEKFELFCEAVNRVIISSREFDLFEQIPVFIFNHHNTWVKGTVMKCKNNASTLVLESDEAIEGGTSGSPIVDESGELVGIASHATIAKPGEGSNGSIPYVKQALPVWVIREIESFSKENGY